MVGKEEKGRAFKPHYMLAGKPQADMTYVNIRMHTGNKCANRGVEKRGEACGKDEFP